MHTQPAAFITGATEGIGRATALMLGRAGYRIGLCARTPSKIRETLEELATAGIQATGYPADVGVEADVRLAVSETLKSLGTIDLLVNNAGIALLKPFEELTLDDWDATMATNLRSLYLVTREVLPVMRARKSGTIVNIASLAARNGFAGGTAYTASKHAVLGFGRSLMMEVRQDGIRVVTICPGSVDTALIRNQDQLKPRLERILQPDDVAQAVLDAVRLPGRALVSELDLRPTAP
jgi:NAD(P)-dependent dehydrogenase (short-subunit alcohol dehydrogenase family)